MDTAIQDFLSSHPYAETTKRTYEDVLAQVFENITDPAALTASGLLSIIQSKTGWGNSRQCVALAAAQFYSVGKVPTNLLTDRPSHQALLSHQRGLLVHSKKINHERKCK